METTRQHIADEVRRLRVERRLTQAELAGRLGLSQSRLSQVERGDGSFTAEQFVEILRIFNLPVSHFVRVVEVDSDAALQNALAQLGATHLRERADVLASPAAENIALAIREALLSGSPRFITALAPIIANEVDRLRLHSLQVDLASVGLERRLLWLLDNVRTALNAALSGRLPRRDAIRYRRAALLLGTFLESSELASRFSASTRGPDILDADIRGKKSLEQVVSAASEISKRWNVVTTLQPDDFRVALEAAHVAA